MTEKGKHPDNTVSDKQWRGTVQGLGAKLAAMTMDGARAQHRSITAQQKAAKQGRN